jgi:predicted GTPase
MAKETKEQTKVEEVKNAGVTPEEVTTKDIVTADVLTIENVSKRVERVKQIVQEEHPVIASEKAHIEQDELLKDVLSAIANGAEDAKGLAEKTLEVFNIDFTRWYK